MKFVIFTIIYFALSFGSAIAQKTTFQTYQSFQEGYRIEDASMSVLLSKNTDPRPSFSYKGTTALVEANYGISNPYSYNVSGGFIFRNEDKIWVAPKASFSLTQSSSGYKGIGGGFTAGGFTPISRNLFLDWESKNQVLGSIATGRGSFDSETDVKICYGTKKFRVGTGYKVNFSHMSSDYDKMTGVLTPSVSGINSGPVVMLDIQGIYTEVSAGKEIFSVGAGYRF